MGSIFTKLLDSFSSMKAKILMIGLDNAGKTTILYKMKLDEVVASQPTIGFNVETVKYKALEFTVWDLGGQTKLINLWHHYYENTDGIIYVLDSSDDDRLDLAKETINNVMSSENLNGSPLLILANKMDMCTKNPADIVQRLGLHQLRREWNLQPCCGLNGDGIAQGFEWLQKQVKKNKK